MSEKPLRLPRQTLCNDDLNPKIWEAQNIFLMGQQNRGTTNYRDYSEQGSAPARPRSGIIRTWLDSLGILNFLASTGRQLKLFLVFRQITMMLLPKSIQIQPIMFIPMPQP